LILLAGDGLGPEIMGPGTQVLDTVAPGEFDYEEQPVRRRVDRRIRDRPDRR
jgi:isocitrate/isopropylmalate dehydrogenase